MSRVSERFTAQPGVIDPDRAVLRGEAVAFPETVRLSIPERSGRLLEPQYQDWRLRTVSVADPKATILVPPAWSDYGSRDFQAYRLAVIAETAQAQVVGIDIPGMGSSKPHNAEFIEIANAAELDDLPSVHDALAQPIYDRLTDRQVELLRRGIVNAVAGMSLEAVLQSETVDKEVLAEKPIVLYGYSMGATIAAALYKEILQRQNGARNTIELGPVTDIVIWEALIAQKRLGTRAMQFALSGADLKYYLSLNPEIEGLSGTSVIDLIKQVVLQRRSHLATARVMARSTDVLDLAATMNYYNTFPDVHLWRGTKSSITTEAEYDGLEDELIGAGLPLSQLDHLAMLGESHAMQDALPLTVHMLGRLSIAQ